MKKIICLFFLVLSPLSLASNLFDYTVFVKNNISAGCSDFLGKTGAGGDVYLRDFLIEDSVHSRSSRQCPLEARGEVKMLRGSVQSQGSFACVRASRHKYSDTGVTGTKAATAPFEKISFQMDTASRLLAHSVFPGVKTITLNPSQIQQGSTILLEAYNDETLVINLDGEVFNFNEVAIVLKGTAKPSSIVWNFFTAKEITIKFSGENMFGIPGTILAPSARITANNSLITGAIFCKDFVGMATEGTCSMTVSAQVNSDCLRTGIPTIGCKSPNNEGKGPLN